MKCNYILFWFNNDFNKHIFGPKFVRAFYKVLVSKIHLFPPFFFNFPADQVFGDQEMNSDVRNMCIDYMVSNILMKDIYF